ncbi:MAG: hypothetical protein IJY66_09065 [Clostridia bacterium]|nr:hypothetical protein [Clostridia bacterium]
MLYYFLVLLSVVCLAINFSINKIYQNRVGSGSRMVVLFNIVASSAMAVLFFFINGWMNGFDTFRLTPFSLLMAAIMALLCGGYSLIGFKIISLGNIAVYTLFLMLGGMMIPYFFGLIYLDEHFSVWRLLGLALMVISIILSGLDNSGTPKDEKNKRTTTLFFILCSVVFCLNGMTSITSKVHQLPQYADMAVTPQLFVLLTAVCRVIFFSIVYFFIRLRDSKLPTQARPAPLKFSLPVLSLMLISAAVEGAAFMLQLIGASHLPATVLYPLITGGVIILTALAGRILFKQKLSTRATIGIILCFASTFLCL